jgi:hypothetical protein
VNRRYAHEAKSFERGRSLRHVVFFDSAPLFQQ